MHRARRFAFTTIAIIGLVLLASPWARRFVQAEAEREFAALRTAKPPGRRRLTEFGANRVESAPRAPLIVRFLRELTHFFAVILWIAVGLAFVAEHASPGSGMATFGFAIAALQKLLPHETSVVRDGRVARRVVETLVPGDIVCLGEGDNVPADCRLIEAFDVRVNNATITGESLPRARSTGPADTDDVLQSPKGDQEGDCSSRP